jgi:predicted nucleic acid-binding protein
VIYIDTSCLIKAVRPEPKSDEVLAAIAKETHVIVSGLAELEALIDFKAGHMAAMYSLSEWRRNEARLALLQNQEPFDFRPVPSATWSVAMQQHRNSGRLHCRTLDRLHLAIAEHFGAVRIMTLDGSQANAARALRFEVVEPGRI